MPENKDKTQVMHLLGAIVISVLLSLLLFNLSLSFKQVRIATNELNFVSANTDSANQVLIGKDCKQICKTGEMGQASCVMGSKSLMVKKDNQAIKQEFIQCDYKFINPIEEDIAGFNKDGVKIVYQCICSDLNPIY